MITAATFVLFGSICVSNPLAGPDWKCMNFWQDPIIHYKTVEECKEVADKKAQGIKDDFDEKGLIIHSLKITCISTGNDIEVDKSLEITYNIL